MSDGKKFNNCVVVFDHNDFGTYFTGQTVSGKVIVTLERPKKLKGIKLQVCGFACCQWRERFGQKIAVQKINPRMKHLCFGREDYVASTTWLVGSDHSNNFTMDAGTYTFTFSCPIPTNCPSSFEGTYGHIRYLVKVTFIRNGAADRIHNVGFTVLKLLDLNEESKIIQSPVTNDAVENVCLLMSKAVHLKVYIQQAGYVPGQYVLVSVNINNQSSVDCKRLIIMLNLRATYTSDTPVHTVSEKICLGKKIGGHVPKYTRKSFTETVRIPATAPTCEHISRVVRISYELCVVAAMNSLMRNPKVLLPITVGNVPLLQGSMVGEDEWLAQREGANIATASSSAAASTNDLEQASGAVGGLTDETSEDDDEIQLPPPTYEEAMFMSTNIADNDANTVSVDAPFTPRYPVFNVDENALAFSSMGLSPPPSLPQKRRRKKRRRQAAAAAAAELAKQQLPTESPIQI
ncbi:arrestin domain-containing protein 17 [Eurosta solidaginis]|uniref:arrestin domain-containing protein 17 n=1 Tax=Eurosta solidaginis TaxID=178769 RepID=UPI00353066DD